MSTGRQTPDPRSPGRPAAGSGPVLPAESRGYRELFLTGRHLVKRWERVAEAFSGSGAASALEKGSAAVGEMLDELTGLAARRGLHSGVAAQGGGTKLGGARAAVTDRFLERNQALRTALADLEHVATLLLYLAAVSESRGDEELTDACRSWDRRLRRHVGTLRKAIVELAGDPDAAVAPLDGSRVGRAAHGVSYGTGAIGEWVDRRLAERRG